VFVNGSFGNGFEVFPFLIVAINHPTTPPTPRNAAPTAFLELLGPWKKNRRGSAAASARQVCRKGEKQRRKNYLFPFFTPASLLLFLVSLFSSL
jgi:hypothetical protein